MNPFEMVVLIVAITAVASVFKAKYRPKSLFGRDDDSDDGDDDYGMDDGTGRADLAAMSSEIRRLRDRVAVLERIATDGEGPARLDREIEALRMKQNSDR